MKTQVIQLEAHDDILSVRDKMTWGQTGRILLVWPKRGQVLHRKLDLLLLQRRAASIGAQIALVTKDSDVHFQAKELGIPTFKTSRQAQTERWRKPKRRRLPRRRTGPEIEPVEPGALRAKSPRAIPPAMLHPALRLALFSISVIAMLAVAAVLLPSAKITLEPAARTQALSLPVSASPEVEIASLTGNLPAHWVSVTVEGRDSITTTGNTSVPEQAATGSVTFTNLTEKAVTIPKNTVVVTVSETPIRFLVTKAGTVASGSGKTVTLPVIAAAPGRTGNLLPGSIQAIEGSLGLSLTVTNKTATSGGANRIASAPTTANRTRLFDELAATLRQTALEEIQDSLAPGDQLLTFSPGYTILEKTYTPETNNQPARQLQLTLRLEVQALVAPGEDIRELATALLDAQMPENYAPLRETLVTEALTAPRLVGEAEAQWTLAARWTIQAQLSPAKAISLSLGLPPSEALQRLEAALPLASDPRIEMLPNWWPRLPFIPLRIIVSSNQ